MSWTTVALIAIAAIVLIVLLQLIAALLLGRRFSRKARRMDEDFEARREEMGFPRRRDR